MTCMSQVPPSSTVSYQHFFMSEEQSTCTSPQPDLVFLQLFPNDIQTKRILLTIEWIFQTSIKTEEVQGTGTSTMIKQYVKFLLIWKVRGAFKIKMKKANKKRTVTVRKVIIFWIFQGTVVFISTKLWRRWRRWQKLFYIPKPSQKNWERRIRI